MFGTKFSNVVATFSRARHGGASEHDEGCWYRFRVLKAMP